jgi:hypothetical protein
MDLAEFQVITSETSSMISRPLRKANPNCAKTFASLRFYGDDLKPDEITSRLQIQPTDSACKGSQSVARSGKSRTAPTGRWVLDTESHIDSTNLEDHLEWLLDQIEAAGVVPVDLPGVSSIAISCYWLSATGQGGPEFSPELLSRLAKWQLTLGLDLYFDSSRS